MPAKVKRVEPLGQIAQRPGDIGSQGQSTVDAYRNTRHGTHARTPRATARALKHGGQRNSATTAKKKQVHATQQESCTSTGTNNPKTPLQ